MPSTPASLARRASSGWQMPLRISGRSVMDRSHGRSSQVSGLPKVCAQRITAAAGSSSGDLARRERKTGSLV